MDGQDDESDKGREDEEDSDDGQAEADKRVAQMLQNQQQYLHMCSSSAHILQLLSHLVPAISGQVMGLESVTEDSEEATSRSDSASSSHSPATSDDNTGCVLWAEPIMTCQLMPSWKPFCGDVRRLPPGVKPEDIKSQHIPTCRGFSNRGYHSAAVTAAAAADAAARNRRQFAANRKNGGAVAANVNSGSVSKDTNSHTSAKESDPNTAATLRCRNERDWVLEDKMPTSSQLPNIQMMRTAAGYPSKAPSAADAIRRTKSILASVTSGRQANNNNNPEEAALGKDSNQESVTTRPANGGSDKNVSGGDGNDRPARSCNAEDHACSAGSSEKRLEGESVKAQNDTSPETHFPAPILVKAAGVKADTLKTQFKETEDGNDTIDVTENVAHAGNPNCSGSMSNVYEICDQTSQTDAFSSQLPTVKKPELEEKSASNERILWERMAARTDTHTSRLIRRARPNGQLYRYPASTGALQPRNRTQHSVSLGYQTEKHIFPPPVNLSAGTQSIKPATHEQLGLDLNFVTKAQNTQRPTRKHIITIAHLKNALKIAMRNLQKINMWTVEANSLRKEPSPHSRSTVSTFTITEVESLNISADQAEKDSMTSDTVEPIVSDLVYERTYTVDINGSGDASKTNADSITEVESIHCVQHSSPNQLCNDLEVCTESPGLPCNDREEKACDRNRTNSSCLRQRDVLMCGRGSSDARLDKEDPPESCSPMSNKYPDTTTAGASGQQKKQLNHCHTEAPFVSIETTAANNSQLKENEVFGKYFNGEPRTQDVNQTETIARDTIVVHLIHSSDQTPVRHSQSNTRWKEDALLHKNHRLNVSWKFPRAKSAGYSICGAQLNNGTKPCRPYSTGEKKTLEGDNDLNNVIVVKNLDDFPPHFPEAGDTVENLKNNPYGSHYVDVNKTETPEHNTPKATEDCRQRDNKCHRKRNLQKSAKRLVFIHTGKSNNASQDRGNTTFRSVSENDDLLVSTLAQSKTRGAHQISTDDSTDDVSESKVEQENQMRVTYLEDRDCDIPLKASVKDKYAEDDDIKMHRHRYACDRNQQDNSSSISDQSYSVVSLPHQTQVFGQSKKDLSLNSIDKSTNMAPSKTSRSVSDSFVTSRHRRRVRISKIERARESLSRRDSKLTDGITSPNVIFSKSNCTQYLDLIPGLMPSENCATRQKLQGKSIKNILILSEFKDVPLSTIKHSSKAKFSENLDKELELAERQSSIQVGSAMAEKGSPDSSESSSIQTPSVTQDIAVAPALDASSEVNTPPTAPLLVEDPPSGPDGLKSRLRRFFSQCLHPFSHRN